jgi:hypothetical protein
LTTETSASEIVVLVVDVLFSAFGSLSEVTEAVLVKRVPALVPAGTCPVNVKDAVPVAKLADEQTIVPPAPTAGVEHDITGPELCTSDTNVIVPGRVSDNTTFEAGSLPPWDRPIA